ncbi:MAG: phage major capsid protein [Proteobacteria bacterium]|nr:phage major capsid protein [Pseudomonadota bacterium]
MDKNLQSKLTELREKDTDLQKRAAELGSKATSDEGLNTDERAELAEIDTSLGELRAKQTDIERALKVGNFSPNSNDDLGLDKDELRNFSLTKLFRACHGKSSEQEKRAAAMELEACYAQASALGVEARGVMIPIEVMRGTKAQRQERRDLTAGVFGSGGAFVGVDQPLPLIELLRNSQLLPSLGATMLPDLVGDVSINKQTGGGTAYWVDGDGVSALTESTQALGQVTLTPKYLGAITDYSRKLLNQSSVGVEQFIRADQMAVLGIEKDRVAFHGNGDGQPTGIVNTTGINTQNFATASTPTRAEIIGMRTSIAVDNALAANMSFCTNPTIMGNMMDTAVDAGSGVFLLSDSGMLIGKQTYESNQIATDHILYGNWADLISGEWGTLDFIVDVYTLAANLMTRVIAVHACDSAVRHAESFCDGSSTY